MSSPILWETCVYTLPVHPLRGTVSSMVINHEESQGASRAGRPPVIFNPDFFVEKLRHENPDVFLELVLSNITRLIDLPGTEFAQLLGEESPKTPTGGNGGFFRSFNFLKRKGQSSTGWHVEITIINSHSECPSLLLCIKWYLQHHVIRQQIKSDKHRHKAAVRSSQWIVNYMCKKCRWIYVL